MTQGRKLAFVVHKHQATALHYDLRLEIGGTMPSWSVPKGPTLDNTMKRLAMFTGDHDLDYRHFEGVLPGEKPGKGVVMIWDEGTYIPEVEISKGVREKVTEPEDAERVAKKSYEEGNLKFTLQGQKLQGSFALVRTRGMGGPNNWLLIKHKDEHCMPGYDAKEYDYSAVSGLTLAQIRSEGEKEA